MLLLVPWLQYLLHVLWHFNNHVFFAYSELFKYLTNLLQVLMFVLILTNASMDKICTKEGIILLCLCNSQSGCSNSLVLHRLLPACSGSPADGDIGAKFIAGQLSLWDVDEPLWWMKKTYRQVVWWSMLTSTLVLSLPACIISNLHISPNLHKTDQSNLCCGTAAPLCSLLQER